MRALEFWMLAVRIAGFVLVVLQLSNPGLKDGGSHAAAEVKASGVSACDHESHQTNISVSGAHGGQIKTPWHGSVPARERGVSSVPGNVLQDMFGSNPNRAPGLCGLSLDASPSIRYINDRSAMLRQSFVLVPRDGRCVSNAAETAWVERRSLVVTGGESAASTSVVEQSAHLKRVPDTRERLAAGLGATSARGCRRRSLARTWFTPREESGPLGGEINKPASGEGLPQGEAFPESGAAHQASRPAEGSSPSRSAHRKQSVRSAQQQENATRLASVALSVTGSAAARPGSIRGEA